MELSKEPNSQNRSFLRLKEERERERGRSQNRVDEGDVERRRKKVGSLLNDFCSFVYELIRTHAKRKIERSGLKDVFFGLY